MLYSSIRCSGKTMWQNRVGVRWECQAQGEAVPRATPIGQELLSSLTIEIHAAAGTVLCLDLTIDLSPLWYSCSGPLKLIIDVLHAELVAAAPL